MSKYGSPELPPLRPPAPPTPRTNRLAVAALVLSVLWLAWLGSLLGLILGLVARDQVKRSGGWQRGAGMATAGVVVGALGLILIAPAAIAGANQKTTSPSVAAPQIQTDGGTVTQGAASTPAPTAAPAPQAQVRVVESGFTQQSLPSLDVIGYGIVLENQSPTAAALGVQLTVTLADTLGRSAASQQQTITAIPAGSRFYVGGSLSTNVSLTIKGLATAVTVGSSTTSPVVLPPVSNLALRPYSIAGLPPVAGYDSVAGNLKDPYSTPLSSYAAIYVVYIDAQGRVVGGGSETPGAAVQPGATVAFTLTGAQVGNATRIEASVDPCQSAYGMPTGESCPIQP